MARQPAAGEGRAPRGAYGLRLSGLEAAASLLVEADPTWPHLKIECRPGETRPMRFDRVSDARAELRLEAGGSIVIERENELAEISAPRALRAEELVHPYLAPIAAVVSYWLGRESFHAGAFANGNGVWAVFGERETGKSSTLAWLALRGHTVVTDDMLILDSLTAFAGPRSVDLRGEAAQALGAGEPLGIVGTRERWRLQLGPVDSALELRGFVFLEWGDSVEVVRLPPSERIARLSRQRGVRLPPRDPARLFALAELPGWELRRPQGWTSLASASERLLEAVGS